VTLLRRIGRRCFLLCLPGSFATALVVCLFISLTACTQVPVHAQTLASDVFSGNWKTNPAKSKYDPANLKPKSAGTSKIDAIANGLKFTNHGFDPAGALTQSEWSGKFDGKDNPVKSDPSRDTAALTKIDDYTIEIISKKAGKVVNTNRIVFSRDGRTRTEFPQGTDSQGRKFNNTVVYERQ
jgi:hypothetical protein